MGRVGGGDRFAKAGTTMAHRCSARRRTELIAREFFSSVLLQNLFGSNRLMDVGFRARIVILMINRFVSSFFSSMSSNWNQDVVWGVILLPCMINVALLLPNLRSRRSKDRRLQFFREYRTKVELVEILELIGSYNHPSILRLEKPQSTHRW